MAFNFVIGVAVATRNEKMPVGVILTFGVASLCIAAYLIPLAILRGALEFRGYAFSLAWGRWLTASIALAALLSNGMLSGLETFAWATLLGEGLTLCLASSTAWRAEIRQSRFMQVNNALLSLREAVPFAAIGIINLLYNRFDIVILGGLSSMREVSQYAPASRIQGVLMMVPSTLGLVVFSVVSTDWCMPGGPERVKKTGPTSRHHRFFGFPSFHHWRLCRSGETGPSDSWIRVQRLGYTDARDYLFFSCCDFCRSTDLGFSSHRPQHRHRQNICLDWGGRRRFALVA
jgi:hypothetical protein